MKKDDSVYLHHILDAIRRIEKYARGISEERFLANDLLQDAVVRQLEVIGEAARNLSPEFQTRHPEIPWNQITGLRNRIGHDYANVDTQIVWEVVTEDLSVLKKQVLRALKDGRHRPSPT